jgi:hypothetical protein
MQKEEFLEVFRAMLVAAFEMHTSSEVQDVTGVVEAASELHRLGNRLSDEAMQVMLGVLITQWAVYVSQDETFMHPEESIDYMIGKLDRMLA